MLSLPKLTLSKLTFAFVAPAALGLAAVQPAQAQSISSFYDIVGTPETLTAPFVSSSGVTTTNLFSGFVEIQVSGAGNSNGKALDDAFYYLPGQTGPDGKPLSPPNEAVPVTRLYQLGVGTATTPFVGTMAQTAIKKGIVFINGVGAVKGGTLPAYNAGSIYDFVIDLPGSSLTPLTFGVLDNVYHDNGGDFTITASQLIPAAAVPEASTTVSCGFLLALGLGSMYAARRRKVQASVFAS